MAGPTGVGNRITPLLAVVTLPLGILAFLFLGLEAAAAVFIVGWLLLVPASAVLLGPPAAEELESLAEVQEAADRLGDGSDGATGSGDPVEKLRDRYASGEIDEVEFERRLEALLETEGLDPTDEEAVERAVDRLHDVKRDSGDSRGRNERELE